MVVPTEQQPSFDSRASCSRVLSQIGSFHCDPIEWSAGFRHLHSTALPLGLMGVWYGAALGSACMVDTESSVDGSARMYNLAPACLPVHVREAFLRQRKAQLGCAAPTRTHARRDTRAHTTHRWADRPRVHRARHSGLSHVKEKKEKKLSASFLI
ncbi:hypothetical protein BCV70DRAFT_89099 [Testicularia cyperi]|uniref:Uncharacterized protein n=1 Tax=Testicularia cyperi TaxID=1882483 RepID=A0A317XRY0_9BASI|nr:hypothetical protein BCV70DRAFT_89099 [Testicularia cyperi]